MNRDAAMNPLMLNEIGMEALSKALSPVDVARFLRLHDKGSGDYTEEREEDLQGISMNDIHAGIKTLREHM